MTYEDSYAPQAPGLNNGNLVTDGYLTANYNALNQPTWMYGNARASGNRLNFGHDPLGRCVKRWDSLGTTYLYYDTWNLITESASATQPLRQYIHGARVDEIVWSKVVASGAQAYHHYDARTHCMMLTGTAQNIIEQYDYDAFGRVYAYNASGTPLTVSGRPGSPYGNRFLFTGREWLWDLGVYDYRHRHYNPELGRFLQPDPKHFGAGDYNLYRYCHNDPVNHVDPTGLWLDKYDYKNPNDALKTHAMLARLWNMDERFQRAIMDMMNSPNRVVIGDHLSTEAEYERVGGAAPRQDKWNRTYPENDARSRNGQGSDVRIEFNPNDVNSQNGKRDPVAGFGHELLGHAQAIWNGNRLPNDPRFPPNDNRQPEEARAQWWEMIVRDYVKQGK